ncbi:MAG: L-lactate dehydrogenase, Fe-S oxidoreductase subunit YkgE [Ignavibacteriae bacterium]|nr:MAG: L-lactate dehydrogenase, Fe-S oxidoreductase subunit YkgE [Ignavibacteriota bacterium]
MKINLFIPCIVDQFAPKVAISTYKILKKLGCNVDYPFEQTCCGQPAFNTGYHYEARICAERFLKIFANSDYIVSPSGSCVAMVKNFYQELELNPEAKSIYNDLKIKIFELSDFLVNVLKVEDLNANFKAKVTYHDSCHLLRELNILNEPRKLIGSIKGIELIDLNESDRCCGFGGTFSVKFPELSTIITEDKVRNIELSGADYVVANDVSCLLNIQGILKNKNSRIKTLHLAELLAMGIENA